MLYTCSTNAPELKSSVTRDRNFKTPYYSNPYGYGGTTFSQAILKSREASNANSPSKKIATRAFNPDTKTILSPMAKESPVRAKPGPQKVEVNHRLVNHGQAVRQKPVWVDTGRASLMRMKTHSKKQLDNSPIKLNRHSQSIDLSSTQKSGTMNSTFTAGFSSTKGSSGFGAASSGGSFSDTFYSSRGESPSYTRRYGKYRLKRDIPTYDFTGGDTPWVNKAGLNTKVNGQEQNFKINYMNYDKEFNSARPVAHTKARKFCSMTRFMKNLEDNRIFQRWKMSAYRGNYR